MSCRRCRASLARHRCSRRVTAGGRSAGNTLQSGSWVRIAEIVSEIVSRAKAGPPGQHLVQHATEGPDVGALVERPAASLFGAEIRRRPEDDAVDGACGGQCRRLHQAGRRAVAVDEFGEPEVEHLHGTRRGEHDVCRFQIAMDDPFLVGGLERVGDLSGDEQRLVCRQGAVGEPRGERLSVDQFEDERPQPGRLLDAVDGADVRVGD